LRKPTRLLIDENGFAVGKTPLTANKPKGTIRIFVMGGSTAFGTIQISERVGDESYPRGYYSYEASIAGSYIIS